MSLSMKHSAVKVKSNSPLSNLDTIGIYRLDDSPGASCKKPTKTGCESRIKTALKPSYRNLFLRKIQACFSTVMSYHN